MVLMIIFAFDPALRHYLEHMVPVAVLPFASNGKRSRLMLSMLLDPIVNDLVQLEYGMRVLTIDRVILFKAHCLHATGDTLAAADLLDHLGHLSLYPCRICIVPATRVGSASYVPASSAHGPRLPHQETFLMLLPSSHCSFTPLPGLMMALPESRCELKPLVFKEANGCFIQHDSATAREGGAAAKSTLSLVNYALKLVEIFKSYSLGSKHCALDIITRPSPTTTLP
ncbi:hypothetical protein DM01DRAFT_330813 [Hesseltinella vesiculosa]|uniref:Uncharacterized protein n=1 Tax=Hesseltinella vesiculosa TaxID=101127 RepID=A0A1X2GRM0_9FUNG|nr:hypothetical protein DM01DRAFT_330813 [Hesseltinella vesiculosa]